MPSISKLRMRPPGRSVLVRLLIGTAITYAVFQLLIRLPPGRPQYSSWVWRPKDSREKNPSSLKQPDHGDHLGHGDQQLDNECKGMTGLDRVVITVKTGATEASSKIPTQLRTSLRCAPHVFVFSDMAQTIGNTQVFDALDTISSSVTSGNSDFDIYRKQYEISDPADIPRLLSNFKDPRRPEDLAAWTLDKYKNLHVVEKAWAMKPDMDWYFHVDADTYVLLPTLLPWLSHLDPSKESFIGSVALINDMPFAHGGSGILLSNAATRNLVVKHNGTAQAWDSKTHENCCGDWVLAQALNECGIEVMNAWPTINGETPATVPFGEDHWCQPVATMHHISPAEAEELGEFEQRRENRSPPILYHEIFTSVISPKVPPPSSPILEDWDNRSDNTAIPDISSLEPCIDACDKNLSCLQALYNGEECFLSTEKIEYGAKREPEPESRKKWQSFWNKTRIDDWVSRQKPCKKVVYPFQGK